MRYIARLFLLLISAFTTTHFAFADPLYTFGNANGTFTDNPVTLGFVFTADQAFSVTSLGWFDAAGDGFQNSHTVGIFDSNGNLLTSTTLEAGVVDPLSGSFRYRAVTPITLESGSTYTLAGTSGGSSDAWTQNDLLTDLSVNPAFTIGPDAARFSYGPDLVDPDSHYSDYMLYAGPNLEGAPVASATPEPADILLLALGLPILFLVRKIRSEA